MAATMPVLVMSSQPLLLELLPQHDNAGLLLRGQEGHLFFGQAQNLLNQLFLLHLNTCSTFRSTYDRGQC